jgi:hypothetical protein
MKTWYPKYYRIIEDNGTYRVEYKALFSWEHCMAFGTLGGAEGYIEKQKNLKQPKVVKEVYIERK